MSIFSKKKLLITHNGAFHADDLFATAVLSILHDGKVKVVRTRDEEIIKKGDYVYDVGGVYSPENGRFDHHQRGGAGVRDNGIPYSSFGLVWKEYGEKICGSSEVAKHIEEKIVESIDAKDNGFDILIPKIKNIFPYSVENIFLSESPTWREDNSGIDKIFKKQVDKVIILLEREIKIAKDDVLGKDMILNTLNKSQDKRIIIMEESFPRYLLQDTLSQFVEPIYFIYPSFRNKKIIGWKVEAVKKSIDTMESRKLFPESWRGLLERDGNLKEITGISDAQFCHASGFFLTAGSKEGAIALAEKALLS